MIEKRHLVTHSVPGVEEVRCWLELPSRKWVAEHRWEGAEPRMFRSRNRNEAIGWLMAFSGPRALPSSFCVPEFLYRPLHEDLLLQGRAENPEGDLAETDEKANGGDHGSDRIDWDAPTGFPGHLEGLTNWKARAMLLDLAQEQTHLSSEELASKLEFPPRFVLRILLRVYGPGIEERRKRVREAHDRFEHAMGRVHQIRLLEGKALDRAQVLRNRMDDLANLALEDHRREDQENQEAETVREAAP